MISRYKFPTKFGEDIFRHKYAQGPNDDWPLLARRVVEDVCGSRWGAAPFPLLSDEERRLLEKYITELKFIPGGRYLYYAGRPLKYFNNCYCLAALEDSREEWGRLGQCAFNALMSGGGIGVDYSRLRPEGRLLKRTGGISSGPIPLMRALNEIGRNVMQGGSRRSALYASLNWQHEDVRSFVYAKEWSDQLKELKEQDFNFPAPLDMTNISVNWDTEFIEGHSYYESSLPNIWNESVFQMCKTGEPGHSYNFWEHEDETLRNACTEFTSEDDSDVCNLGSVNLGNIETLDEFNEVVRLGSKFLVCGTLRGDVPYSKVREVRDRNRKIGLGVMGVHEWLLKRGHKYAVTDDLREWLEAYSFYSEQGANSLCDRLYLNRPLRYRAIAPTGTIGILAGTTTGIEPVYSVAYKRRYLDGGSKWKYQFVVDGTAQRLIEEGVSPDSIESSTDLSNDLERRIKFQADIQEYVDMGVSSTINLPAWGTDTNNPDTVEHLSKLLFKYAPKLRGITAYPDGARGGQPHTSVPYEEAVKKRDVVYEETEDKCKGGVCGV